MIKALFISLVFWVVIVPGAIGSFLILRCLLDSDPVLYYLLIFVAVGVSALATVLGPILFPLQVAGESDSSFPDPQIPTCQEDRSA